MVWIGRIAPPFLCRGVKAPPFSIALLILGFIILITETKMNVFAMSVDHDMFLFRYCPLGLPSPSFLPLSRELVPVLMPSGSQIDTVPILNRTGSPVRLPPYPKVFICMSGAEIGWWCNGLPTCGGHDSWLWANACSAEPGMKTCAPWRIRVDSLHGGCESLPFNNAPTSSAIQTYCC